MNFNLTSRNIVFMVLITSVWINLSEVFRYFIFVMPKMKAYWPNRNDIAVMDPLIFSIWGIWDTVLTFLLVMAFLLWYNVVKNHRQAIWRSGFSIWVAVFVIFWIGAANMGFSPWSILWIVWPMSLLEMIVGSWVVSMLYKRMVKS